MTVIFFIGYFIVGLPIFCIFISKLASVRSAFWRQLAEYLILYVLWLPIVVVYVIIYVVLSLANSLSK